MEYHHKSESDTKPTSKEVSPTHYSHSTDDSEQVRIGNSATNLDDESMKNNDKKTTNLDNESMKNKDNHVITVNPIAMTPKDSKDSKDSKEFHESNHSSPLDSIEGIIITRKQGTFRPSRLIILYSFLLLAFMYIMIILALASYSIMKEPIKDRYDGAFPEATFPWSTRSFELTFEISTNTTESDQLIFYKGPENRERYVPLSLSLYVDTDNMGVVSLLIPTDKSMATIKGCEDNFHLVGKTKVDDSKKHRIQIQFESSKRQYNLIVDGTRDASGHFSCFAKVDRSSWLVHVGLNFLNKNYAKGNFRWSENLFHNQKTLEISQGGTMQKKQSSQILKKSSNSYNIYTNYVRYADAKTSQEKLVYANAVIYDAQRAASHAKQFHLRSAFKRAKYAIKKAKIASQNVSNKIFNLKIESSIRYLDLAARQLFAYRALSRASKLRETSLDMLYGGAAERNSNAAYAEAEKVLYDPENKYCISWIKATQRYIKQAEKETKTGSHESSLQVQNEYESHSEHVGATNSSGKQKLASALIEDASQAVIDAKGFRLDSAETLAKSAVRMAKSALQNLSNGSFNLKIASAQKYLEYARRELYAFQYMIQAKTIRKEAESLMHAKAAIQYAKEAYEVAKKALLKPEDESSVSWLATARKFIKEGKAVIDGGQRKQNQDWQEETYSSRSAAEICTADCKYVNLHSKAKGKCKSHSCHSNTNQLLNDFKQKIKKNKCNCDTENLRTTADNLFRILSKMHKISSLRATIVKSKQTVNANTAVEKALLAAKAAVKSKSKSTNVLKLAIKKANVAFGEAKHLTGALDKKIEKCNEACKKVTELSKTLNVCQKSSANILDCEKYNLETKLWKKIASDFTCECKLRKSTLDSLGKIQLLQKQIKDEGIEKVKGVLHAVETAQTLLRNAAFKLNCIMIGQDVNDAKNAASAASQMYDRAVEKVNKAREGK